MSKSIHIEQADVEAAIARHGLKIVKPQSTFEGQCMVLGMDGHKRTVERCIGNHWDDEKHLDFVLASAKRCIEGI